jgi:hypothetical protein
MNIRYEWRFKDAGPNGSWNLESRRPLLGFSSNSTGGNLLDEITNFLDLESDFRLEFQNIMVI